MPKTSKNHHLKLHHKTWVFRHRWPKDVQKSVGQTEFIKSLKTKNLYEALIERDVLLAQCLKHQQLIRSGDHAAIQEELIRFRGLWVDKNPENWGEEEKLQDQIFNRAVELNVDGGMPALWEEINKDPEEPSMDYALQRLGALEKVNDYIHIATGKQDLSLSLPHYLNEWSEWRQRDVKLKTVEDGKAVVLRFAIGFPTLDDVNKRDVFRWFERERQISKLSVSRRKKMKGHLISYWTFLQKHLSTAVVPEDVDPFVNVTFPKQKKRSYNRTTGWKEFPKLGDDVVRILNAAVQKNDQPLWELIILLIYTGLRPEEAVQLKPKDVHKDEQGHWFHVADSKTPAGIRDIPIHGNIQHLFDQWTVGRKEEFVISNITSKNKYEIRSDPISKRFGGLKKKLGYGPQTVLYSCRKTVITLMDQASVRTSVIADVVGHEPESFTLSTYSGGSSMEQKRDAIHCLKYPNFNHNWVYTG